MASWRELAALERLVCLDVLGHPLLDPGQVLLARTAVRELDVVVEAVVDRRPDRDLRLRPDVEHRLRQHVRGVVADQLQRLGALVRDDLDPLAVLDRRREIAELAVDLERERGLRQPRTDRGGGVGTCGAGIELELGVIGQLDPDHAAKSSRGRSHPACRDARLGRRTPLGEPMGHADPGPSRALSSRSR